MFGWIPELCFARTLLDFLPLGELAVQKRLLFVEQVKNILEMPTAAEISTVGPFQMDQSRRAFVFRFSFCILLLLSVDRWL